MSKEERKSNIEERTDDEFVFMREEIKARPINRKKLARNTILAAVSAVVFGTVACVTFALIAPFVMDKLSDLDEESNKQEPIVISFPEETQDEEMTPSDMLTKEQEEADEESQVSYLEEEEIEKLISSVQFTISDYQDLYKSLGEIAAKAKKTIVRVTPLKQGTDWFDNLYESTSELSGVILYKSQQEYLIATKYSPLKGYEEIVVSFVDGTQANAELIASDTDTDTAMLSVQSNDISEETKEELLVAQLGISSTSTILGAPVIAVGSPMGNYNSVNYGMVTSNTGKISVIDNVYKQIVTNIYGSQTASGILINLRGDVIGIIDTKYSSSDTKNLVCAFGITEYKRTLERMMNRADVVLLGITGSDVPNEAIAMGSPDGVFVTSVEMDSPAMNAGIQSGDIISMIDTIPITRVSEFVLQLRQIELDSTHTIVVNRKVQDSYKEVSLEVDFYAINK